LQFSRLSLSGSGRETTFFCSFGDSVTIEGSEFFVSVGLVALVSSEIGFGASDAFSASGSSVFFSLGDSLTPLVSCSSIVITRGIFSRKLSPKSAGFSTRNLFFCPLSQF